MDIDRAVVGNTKHPRSLPGCFLFHAPLIRRVIIGDVDEIIDICGCESGQAANREAPYSAGTRKLSMMRDRIQANRLGASMMAFVAYTTVMLVLERRMRRAGGAGIIPFELAGNASRAEAIMTRWGSDGQRAARLSLWLDFGYMATYGTLMALLVERIRRRRGHSAALPAMVIVAVAGDALEGVSLLKVLNGTRVAVYSRRAQIAALVKFAVLAFALGYVAAGSFGRDHH
jgi:hypothetical protein